MSGGKRTYEIGKCRPPESTKFRPGQSGNPKGRPKGRRNFASEIEEVLTATVPITENGCPRKVTSRMAALMKLRKQALEGNLRALDRYLELALQQAADLEARTQDRTLSAAEDEILTRYVESRSAQVSLDLHDEAGRAGNRDD